MFRTWPRRSADGEKRRPKRSVSVFLQRMSRKSGASSGKLMKNAQEQRRSVVGNTSRGSSEKRNSAGWRSKSANGRTKSGDGSKKRRSVRERSKRNESGQNKTPVVNARTVMPD
jgi:hypothetical protein